MSETGRPLQCGHVDDPMMTIRSKPVPFSLFSQRSSPSFSSIWMSLRLKGVSLIFTENAGYPSAKRSGGSSALKDVLAAS